MPVLPPTDGLSTLAMPDYRAAWRVGPSGFAQVAPLSARRAMAAVGRVVHPDARAEIATVLADIALSSGHDAAALLGWVNSILELRDLGAIDAVALLSRDEDGSRPSVAAAGRPRPRVVRIPSRSVLILRRPASLRTLLAVELIPT